MASDTARPILPAMITVGEIMIITTLYCFIRLYSSVQIFVLCTLFCVGFFATVVLTLGIWSGLRATEYSEKYIALANSVQMTKEEKIFFISCSPLRWRIGNTFLLCRDSLPTIFKDIIVGFSIQLLITFK